MPQPQPTLVTFFFTFLIFGGHFGMALIFITVLISKEIRKHALLLNFLASWALYTTSFCILLYTGHQFDIERPLGLCVLQSSMVYGSAISTPLSGLSLIFNIWLRSGYFSKLESTPTIEVELEGMPGPRHSSWTTIALIAIPHVAFTFVAIWFAFESQGSGGLERSQNSLYCNLSSDTANAVPYLAGLIVFCIVVLEILLARNLYKIKNTPQWLKIFESGDIPVSLVIRIGIFSLFGFLSLLAAIDFWFNFRTTENDSFPHMIQAALPTAAFLIFRTQRDLLIAWRIIPLWNWLFKNKNTHSTKNLSSANSSRIPTTSTLSFNSKGIHDGVTVTPTLVRSEPDSVERQPSYPVANQRSFVPSFISVSSIIREY